MLTQASEACCLRAARSEPPAADDIFATRFRPLFLAAASVAAGPRSGSPFLIGSPGGYRAAITQQTEMAPRDRNDDTQESQASTPAGETAGGVVAHKTIPLRADIRKAAAKYIKWLKSGRAGAAPREPAPQPASQPTEDQLGSADAVFAAEGYLAGEGEICAVVWPNTAPETVLKWLKIAEAAPSDAGDSFLEGDGRLIINKVEHPEINALKDDIKALHWFSEETRFDVDALDARDLEKSSPELMKLVRTVIGLSMVSDGLILDGLEGAVGEKLGNVIEAMRYLAFVAQNEAVHEESYLLQGKAIAGSSLDELVDSVRNMPSVGRLADWGRFWTVCDHPAAALFAGLAFVEGAMFQGIFAVLQFLKTLGKFPGVVHVNEFVARDEWVHTQFWILLSTKKIDRKMPSAAIAELARASAEVSAGFFREAMPTPVPGMSAELLVEYVEFINDFIASELTEGKPASPVFGTADPFPFMKLLRMGAQFRKTNFFERESSTYRKDQADTDGHFTLGKVGVGADEVEVWPL